QWKMCDGWPAGPAPSGMLSRCSRTGEHDEVARVASFDLAQPSPLWSGAGQTTAPPSAHSLAISPPHWIPSIVAGGRHAGTAAAHSAGSGGLRYLRDAR